MLLLPIAYRDENQDTVLLTHPISFPVMVYPGNIPTYVYIPYGPRRRCTRGYHGHVKDILPDIDPNIDPNIDPKDPHSPATTKLTSVKH
jgi:hypothetical protein